VTYSIVGDDRLAWSCSPRVLGVQPRRIGEFVRSAMRVLEGKNMKRFPWELVVALLIVAFFTWLLFTPYIARVSSSLAAGANKALVISIVVVLFLAAGAYVLSTARRSRL
jgi:hypothetical protein